MDPRRAGAPPRRRRPGAGPRGLAPRAGDSGTLPVAALCCAPASFDRQQIAAIGARKAGLSTNSAPFARSVARNEESVTNAD